MIPEQPPLAFVEADDHAGADAVRAGHRHAEFGGGAEPRGEQLTHPTHEVRPPGQRVRRQLADLAEQSEHRGTSSSRRDDMIHHSRGPGRTPRCLHFAGTSGGGG
jgi:hypothetical protein